MRSPAYNTRKQHYKLIYIKFIDILYYEISYNSLN